MKYRSVDSFVCSASTNARSTGPSSGSAASSVSLSAPTLTSRRESPSFDAPSSAIRAHFSAPSKVVSLPLASSSSAAARYAAEIPKPVPSSIAERGRSSRARRMSSSPQSGGMLITPARLGDRARAEDLGPARGLALGLLGEDRLGHVVLGGELGAARLDALGPAPLVGGDAAQRRRPQRRRQGRGKHVRAGALVAVDDAAVAAAEPEAAGSPARNRASSRTGEQNMGMSEARLRREKHVMVVI